MELTQAFEDRAVRRLLVGDEADIAEAFAQVDTHLRKRFVNGARDRLPGLRPEDLADAWQEMLRDLLKAVRERHFDPDLELRPWLWTIFIRRAFDCVRRMERSKGLVEGVRGRFNSTTAGDILEFMDDEERKRLLASVRQAVSTLPIRQRTVIQVFLDQFPATEDVDVLREHVSKVTGHEHEPLRRGQGIG